MEYLARAIPVSADVPSRFILTDTGDTSKWLRLGIEPIWFPKRDYGALNVAVEKLAEVVNRGAMQWSETIRSATNSLPRALSDEEADILDFALQDANDAQANVEAFARYASSVEWIVWLENRGHLRRLFEEHEFSRFDHVRARWITSRFAVPNSDDVFRLIGSNNMCLHPQFWYALTRHVSFDRGPTLSAQMLGQWVSILLETVPKIDNGFWAPDLAQRCIELNRFDDVVDILECVSHLKGVLTHEGSIENKLGLEIRFGDSQTAIPTVFELLRPYLDIVAERLVAMALHRLESHHRKLATWNQADRNMSSSSFAREKIEVDDNNYGIRQEQAIINIARDALAWLAHNKPSHTCTEIVDRLIVSDVPLLRRLAYHTMRAMP